MAVAIQHDALDGDTTIRAISQRWDVPRRLVRRVLDSAVFPDRTTPGRRPENDPQTEQQVHSMMESGMGGTRTTPERQWAYLASSTGSSSLVSFRGFLTK